MLLYIKTLFFYYHSTIFQKYSVFLILLIVSCIVYFIDYFYFANYNLQIISKIKNENIVCKGIHMDFTSMDHVKKSFEELKDIYDKCEYNQNDYINIVFIKNTLVLNKSEIFAVKINITNVLNFIGDANFTELDLNCNIQLFVKDLDKPECLENISLNRVMVGDKLNLSNVNEFTALAYEPGFYELNCFINSNQSPIFKDIFNIFPEDMTKLIIKNKYYFDQIEESKENFKKQDSRKNPMLSDGDLFEECDNQNNQSKTLDKMNIIMLYFDSVSNAQFQRIFPQTFEYLNSLNGNILLKNHFVVGENSLPNFISLLTGVNILVNNELNITNEKEFYDDIDYNYFDLYPFIWRDFEKLGYLTNYAEDYLDMGLFSYFLNGFRFPPTSVYFPTYWRTYDAIKTGPFMCHNKKPTYQTILDNIQNFIGKMNSNQNVNYFFFNLMNYYTHDVDSLPKGFDLYFKEILKKFESKGFLEKTLLIIGGDHGARLNSYSMTELGFVEHKLPYTSVRLPKKLWNTKYHYNFIRNSEILTTNYDIHKTLKHFYFWNKYGINNLKNGCINLFNNSYQKIRGLRGISLFEEINSNRNCLEANVPLSICACNEKFKMNEEEFINETKFNFISAAKLILNKIVSKTNEIRDLCENFNLYEINEAYKIFINQKMFYKFRITLQPGDAAFEGSINISKNKSLIIDGMVERINRYGDQSICVPKKIFEGFCYCKINKKN